MEDPVPGPTVDSRKHNDDRTGPSRIGADSYQLSHAKNWGAIALSSITHQPPSRLPYGDPVTMPPHGYAHGVITALSLIAVQT